MSLGPKSYAEALEKANSRPQKARQRLSRGTKGLVRSPFSASGSPAVKQGSNSALVRSRKPINKAGPATREWAAARAWLDRQFKKAGISACQFRFKGCWGANAVHYAHPAKRRHLKEGELYVAAKACDPCHDILDNRSKTSVEEMRALVETAFNSAGIKRKVA